jgi:hypothetical protein
VLGAGAEDPVDVPDIERLHHHEEALKAADVAALGFAGMSVARL